MSGWQRLTTNPYHPQMKPKNGADSKRPLHSGSGKARANAINGPGNIRKRSIGTMR